MAARSIISELASELCNLWIFCGNETDFWREKKREYLLTEDEIDDISQTADNIWTNYGIDH